MQICGASYVPVCVCDVYLLKNWSRARALNFMNGLVLVFVRDAVAYAKPDGAAFCRKEKNVCVLDSMELIERISIM